MKSRVRFYILIGLLAAAGLGLIAYKHFRLGFPLAPGVSDPTWIVEARITFRATGKPVEVSLGVPEPEEEHTILEEDAASLRFGFAKIRQDGELRAVWSAREKVGSQTLYYRIRFRDPRAMRLSFPGGPGPPEPPPLPTLEGPRQVAAENLVSEIRALTADAPGFLRLLLERLNSANPSPEVRLLLRENAARTASNDLIFDLLALERIPFRRSFGVRLEDGLRRREAANLIEVYDQGRWHVFDPERGEPAACGDLVIWQRGGRSLLDIEGGETSRVTFSVTRDPVPAGELARQSAGKVAVLDFSIFSLPVAQQNAFKLLLLVPLGALVVCVMRNVVGLPTSGTFMPVLFALAFLETQLLTGIVLLVVVVGAGLFIRTYLASLNLLLVPRISAGVIVVVVIMAAFSIVSHKLGWEAGLRVTFFPMIILAWTIERMSILWEESGAKEALVQASGSLVVAIFAYLLMANKLLQFLTFTYPELILLVLAATLWLGNYRGYRLLELVRFRQFAESGNSTK